MDVKRVHAGVAGRQQQDTLDVLYADWCGRVAAASAAPVGSELEQAAWAAADAAWAAYSAARKRLARQAR